MALWTAAAPASVLPQEPPDLDRQAVVTTSEGVFVLSFHPDKAPLHVRLFLELAQEGAYDGTLFHQVVKWGTVSAGDPLSRDTAKKKLWGSGGMNKVKAETSDIKHERGTLSSVLLPGKPDSGGSQFFICITPQPQLDGLFSAFGTVSEGIEVLDRISETPADANGVPHDPPVIRKVELRPAQPPPPPAYSLTSSDELARYRVVLETSVGDITLAFFADLAPNHVRNFLRIAEAGFYDGTAFHRVVPDFVVQGGLLSTREPPLPDFRMRDLVRKLQPEFNDARHVKGVLSMARYDEPDSAETSFFLCLGDAAGLDREYTAFGKVVEGMEILEKFQSLALEGETPRERVALRKVSVVKPATAPD